jgi:inosose dehydratase
MFSAVGRQTVMAENVAVPAIVTLGYAGVLAGPPVIGFVSHLVIPLRRVSDYDRAVDRCVEQWTVYTVVRSALPCTQTHRTRQSDTVLATTLTSLLKNQNYDSQRKDRSKSLTLGAHRKRIPTLSSRSASGLLGNRNYSIQGHSSRPARRADLSAISLASCRIRAGAGTGSFFHEVPIDEITEGARQHAAVQAELGNTEVFIAAGVGGVRMKRPAVGADADPAVLARVIDGLGAAVTAISAEGVRPLLHPHVGSAIEVEDEIHAVLGAIEESLLGFGPDTGHLTWAGMDAVNIMSRYASRIGGMHLKDVHADQVNASRAAGATYHESTREGFTVWTEPGRGDINLPGALATLPESFHGWIVVEVDVPEALTNIASTQISAAWIAEQLGAGAFTAKRR